MEKLSPPSPMLLNANLADNWKRFKQRFNIYLAASGAGADNEKLKAHILLHVIGEDALDIYNSFQLDEANLTLEQLMTKFEEYFVPRQNVTFERYKFFTHDQKQGVPFDQYMAELHTLSKTCEFDTLRDSLVRDRIVCGTMDNALRERLLRETGLTLDKCVSMCRAAETTRAQAKELRRGETTVHAIHKEQWKNKMCTKQKDQKDKSMEFKCGKCGGSHKPKYCPAYGKTCNNCGRSNHYAKCCKAASRKKVHTVEEDDDKEEFIVNVVQACTVEKEEWIVPITVNQTTIPFKLDTGAHVNLLSLEDYKTLTVKSKIHPVKTKVSGYTGERVPVKGGCIATFKHKGRQMRAQLLIVDMSVQPILGLSACTKLNLVKRVFVVTSQETTNAQDTLMEEYKDCFQGLGCLPGLHKICVDKNVFPVVHPCRKVPFALREKLKDELARMEKLGVIKRIDEPTEWVSSLVVVQKKTGALRICLDPRDLNKAIRREHFKLPTREEIMAQFAGAKWFSKLDASSGFWQMKLGEESSRLCTFNTPEGRYRFLRLPYGILSAPEVYHKTIHMIFEHIPGVETMMDDIIVWGSTRKEHDERLRQVLDKTREVNLKLNKEKCEFGVKSLTFVGDVVSEEGVKPDPRKTSAINNMERPTNKDEVRRFLGMVTYLAKFVPQLSTQSAPLRSLLEQKNEWIWSHEQEQCFLKLKETLTQEPVLKFYDPEKSTRISADASQYGLGAVLLQQHEEQWLPVAYASRALTSAETRYAQIEKELLASLYACERFHQYVYGQMFQVETDHKPLVSIMNKPLNDCPVRIQRMLIRLQKYDVHMIYTQGKYMYTADTLSRAVDKRELADSDNSTEIQAYVDMVVTSLPVTADRTEQIRKETIADETMKELKSTVQNGWPDNKKDCPLKIQDYWNCRAELTVVDDIVLKGSKFVIPYSLRKQMLEKIHEGHLGEVKCKRRAREVMFWPRINQDISQTTASCGVCRTYRPKQQAEPLMTHPVPHRPYYKVGTDLFDFDGRSYVVVTDYFSNYPEIGALQSTTSKAVVSYLKTVFARHGVPCELFSDNGPQFSSCEFAAFAKEWGFQHSTSSPTYPKSNGLAECSVKTVKNLLKKSQDKDDFQKSLLIYRSAPLQNGLSPAQMLMGRRIRSNLPVNEDLLTPKGAHKIRHTKEVQKAKQKQLHDRTAKHLPMLRHLETKRTGGRGSCSTFV
ncbi:uncharacterized protein K02A2.6-like isoform X2 [Entelurus aequoreus]|uniref:uncharacterized protein K02A2.6-like isoform X2 n=1 Tax=Entelurus aequoreus TaxID=161455 RepID=UPI002B1D73EF|nr:uncharacterized protein K02A2.6-like isoform X2 [Entelurus aequoreus]